MSSERVWFYYAMLAPVRECYHDDGGRVLFQLPVRLESGAPMEVALVGEANAPEFIRIRLESPTNEFSDEQWEAINHLADYMLTTIRLVYDYTADFARHFGKDIAAWSEANKDGLPTLSIEVKQTGVAEALPIGEIKNTFAHTFDKRALFNALADSQRPALPLRYRYLCLYKVLEHEFKIAGKWDERLKSFLQPHEAEFKTLDCGQGSFLAAVKDLRDKTAHISTGKRSDVMGITWRDEKRIRMLMPLLHRIVMAHVIKKYGLSQRPKMD